MKPDMTTLQIKNAYKNLTKAIQAHRLQNTVTVPVLFDKHGKYTIAGLSIVFFFHNFRKIVHIRQLAHFLRSHKCCIHSNPNPRHFGMQYGFYFLINNSYHPKNRQILKPGQYCLYSIAKPHPNAIHKHRNTDQHLNNPHTWTALKKAYDYRCAHCGSIEGQHNLKNKLIITQIEKGHMNPNKPLDIDNCIPICTLCNHVYKDTYIFNKNGFIVDINQNKALCNVGNVEHNT